MSDTIEHFGTAPAANIGGTLTEPRTSCYISAAERRALLQPGQDQAGKTIERTGMAQSGDVERVKIAIVDDDDLFRESIAHNLSDAGFAVTELADGPSALRYLLDEGEADLVILDWKMPEMNGIEVLRRMREANLGMPVVFLTSLSDQIYEEAALMGGAVDFVEKSRSFTILKKRIELTLANARPAETGDAAVAVADRAKLGRLELRADVSRALWNSRQVDLTLTEFKIVQHLANNAGGDVTYREIYDIVRGHGFVAGTGDDGYRSNVRTFVKRIRQKFRNVDNGFEEIENYPGFGYRWRAEPTQQQ